MKVRWLAAAFAAGWLSLPSAAQTVPQLLQKGIYTQETAGDLDGAIRIYRQILGAAEEFRTYAAQAQYRLAQCLLAKGDKAEAAKALEKLSRDYPEQADLMKRAREGMPELAGLVSQTLDYPRIGISFTLPPGWRVDNMGFWDQDALVGTVNLQASIQWPARLGIWMKSQKYPKEKIVSMLRGAPEWKAKLRPAGWRARPETFKEGMINGAHTFGMIADAAEKGAAEYLVWLQTENTSALFFCTMAEAELQQAIPHFDRFLETIKLR